MKKIIKINLLALFLISPLLSGMDQQTPEKLVWEILEATELNNPVDNITLEKYKQQLKELLNKYPLSSKTEKYGLAPMAYALKNCYNDISHLFVEQYKKKLAEIFVQTTPSKPETKVKNHESAVICAQKLIGLYKDLITLPITQPKTDKFETTIVENAPIDPLAFESRLLLEKVTTNEWNISLRLGTKKVGGVIECTYIKKTTNAELHIAKLFVTQKERKSGLGSTLLLTALDIAKELRGNNGINVTLTAQPLVKDETKTFMRPILIDFYRSHDFVITDNKTNQMGLRIDKIGNILTPHEFKKEQKNKIVNYMNRHGASLFSECAFENNEKAN